MEKEFLEDDNVEGFRDFQKPSSIDPALARVKSRNSSGDDCIGSPRSRSQTFSAHRKISPTERERASSFSQLKSSKYLERVKKRREQNPVKFVFCVYLGCAICTFHSKLMFFILLFPL